MESAVKQRLKEFLKFKKIGQNRFADICGLSKGYVNNISVSIQPKTLEKIISKYPELNASWLLIGEGEMIKNNSEPQHKLFTIEEDKMKIISMQEKIIAMYEAKIKLLESDIKRYERELQEIQRAKRDRTA